MENYGKLFLTLKGGQQKEYTLAKELVTLGRATTNEIIITDPAVSRQHATLLRREGGWVIEDLDSANGTWVNGVQVRRAKLEPTDVIQVGEATLRLQTQEPFVEEEEITPEETIIIDQEADLEKTLAEETMEISIPDTSLPRVVICQPGKTWEVKLTKGVEVIGRSPANDIVLADPQVSRCHAQIRRRGKKYFIVDLNSTNGTWFKGQRIHEKRLQQGDVLQIGETKLIFKEGFEPESLALAGPPQVIRRELKRHPVVVLPGFMGSELWRGNELIWPNLKSYLGGPELSKLADKAPVEARRLIEQQVIVPNLIKLEQYSRLLDYLEESLGYCRGKDLLEFPYDWRQDSRASAQKLKEAIESWLQDQGHDKVIIIAHSMGCLVSRYYVERLGGKNHTERLIFLGGPHYGTPKTLLLGQGISVYGRLGDKFRAVIASFPSAYQSLPIYPCVVDANGKPVDVFADEGWVAREQRPLVQGARAFWKELGEASSVPTVCIFGYGVKTVTKVVIKSRERGEWKEVLFLQEKGGDNTIPQESAILKGAEIHPVQQYHGALYTDNDVKMRLKLELMK